MLPFFHSFGFTGTLWLPLVGGFGVVYHPNPMDAKTIGELAAKYQARRCMISTPTFCSAYIRKCEPRAVRTLRYAIVGAEKLREPIATAFKEKFGIELLEGYGCTEMSPVVAVNVPDVEDGTANASAARAPARSAIRCPASPRRSSTPRPAKDRCSIGKGCCSSTARTGCTAISAIRSKTAEVLRDGWYVTGDIATIDEGGFIRITDRLSRFSKIAGEMVPHMKIEEQIQALLARSLLRAWSRRCRTQAKGERLVAFYTDPDLDAAATLWERLCQTELPRLWLPKREDLRFVDAIPTLGTGKVDLRGGAPARARVKPPRPFRPNPITRRPYQSLWRLGEVLWLSFCSLRLLDRVPAVDAAAGDRVRLSEKLAAVSQRSKTRGCQEAPRPEKRQTSVSGLKTVPYNRSVS